MKSASYGQPIRHPSMPRTKHTTISGTNTIARIKEEASRLHQARQWNKLLRLILQHADTLLDKGYGHVIEGMLLGLPDKFLRQEPWSLYWLGMCEMDNTPSLACKRFEEAFEAFEKNNDLAGIFQSWSGMVDAIIARNDFTLLDSWIGKLDALLEKNIRFPSGDTGHRVAVNMFRSLLYRQPDRSDLADWAKRVKNAIRHQTSISRKLTIAQHLANYHLLFGEPARMGVLLRTVQPALSSARLQPEAKIQMYLLEAKYCWFTAAHQKSLKMVSEALSLAQKKGVHHWNFELYSLGIATRISLDELPEAELWLEHQATLLPNQGRVDTAYHHFLTAWLFLLRADLPAAKEHAQLAWDLYMETGTPLHQALTAIGLSQIYIGRGERQLALETLSQAEDMAQKTGSMHLAFLSALTSSQLCLEENQTDCCIEQIAKAFHLGKQQGLLNAYWWDPKLMARLCVVALEHGFEKKYAQKIVQHCRLTPERSPLNVEDWPWPVKVYTLGRFVLLKQGQPVRFPRKAQRKPLELLKVLIAYGSREISEERLTSVLWPDAEGDAAHNAFDITLHRLRKLIGNEKAVILQDGKLSLDDRYCWVDTWAFEWLLGMIEGRLLGAKGPVEGMEIERLSAQALALYHGHFLSKESLQPWLISLREKLRSKFLRHLMDIAHYWEQQGKWESAVVCYKRGLEVDDLAEQFYQRLMICYRQLGRRSEALAVYQRCRTTLSMILRIEPAAETEAIRRSLMAN